MVAANVVLANLFGSIMVREANSPHFLSLMEIDWGMPNLNLFWPIDEHTPG